MRQATFRVETQRIIHREPSDRAVALFDAPKPGPLPTLGHYRNDHGIRTFTVYCLNGVHCWHRATLTFDELPDDTIAKSLDHRMVCIQCGLIGQADVRPDWHTSPLTRNRGP